MIYCFPSVNELSQKLSVDFLDFIAKSDIHKPIFNIAVSGGTTPEAFFAKIAANQHLSGLNIPWNKVHFFWVDERCVPPGHANSNFGMTNRSLLQKIDLAESNIHRIHGENDPSFEALRYADEIEQHVELQSGIPVFDWIFLGVGNDGHTASIFPDRLDLLDSLKVCEAISHPASGQCRITLTGKPILLARRLTFMVAGATKSQVIRQIINNEPESLSYPAARIHLQRSEADWYIDAAAAKYLTNHLPW